VLVLVLEHREVGRKLLRVVPGVSAKRARPAPVDRPVDDDAMEPRAEWATPVEGVQGSHCRQERLLRDVLGGRAVVHDEVRSPIGAGPVVAKECLEVRGRSGLGAAHPGALVAACARHRLPTIRLEKPVESTLELRSGEPFGSGVQGLKPPRPRASARAA